MNTFCLLLLNFILLIDGYIFAVFINFYFSSSDFNNQEKRERDNVNSKLEYCFTLDKLYNEIDIQR